MDAEKWKKKQKFRQTEIKRKTDVAKLEAVKARFGPTDKKREWVEKLKEKLAVKYPKYKRRGQRIQIWIDNSVKNIESRSNVYSDHAIDALALLVEAMDQTHEENPAQTSIENHECESEALETGEKSSTS